MRIKELFSGSKIPKRIPVRPYLIAEAGVNHEGDMDLAQRLIREAAEGGADAIKFQTYKASTIASKNSPSYWDLTKEPTTSQFELFSKYDKFWKGEFEQLKEYCDQEGIEFLSTPFDLSSAAFLNDLMDGFKISSSDLTNKPFIEALCSYSKPILLSTGAAELWEIEEAVSWIDRSGNDLCLLHCVLNYPTPDAFANLGMITHLNEKFPDRLIGYSDHTLPGDMHNLEIAVLLGVRVIEKHFTHDKTLPGNDHYHAMDVRDLKRYQERLDQLFKILGSFQIKALEEEAPAIQNARRSLVTSRKIEEGKVIQKEDLTFKRPAFGISPRSINEVIGMRARRTIQEDEILKWGMLCERDCE